ncbi:unnamed protein product [Sympodiomycopsis kandeliae]
MLSRTLLTIPLLSLGAIGFPDYAKDKLQCLKDSTQLSCHSNFNVSTDSCCYNGALKPGDKESGLLLVTSFWNAEPSFGPNDSTTIHGLWPDYCDGTYPQFCTAESGIPQYSGIEIDQILSKYDPDLLDYFQVYYKDNTGDDAGFRSHEWNKHGTCFNALRAQCFKPKFKGQTPEEAALVAYFQEIAKRFKKTPTYKWLTEAGIKPSHTQNYTLSQLETALSKRNGGKKPYLGCTNHGTKLDEFWYYYNTFGSLINGIYIPVDSTTKSSCNETGIQWLPK